MVALNRIGAALVVCGASSAGAQTPLRYPEVRGGQIRIEGYLVPQVTSWPSYPSWSPDGREIAFSMDGRIWVVPAERGEAVQVTTGEGYDFEPDCALPVEGGVPIPLTRDPGVDHFAPAWSPDGEAVVYVSNRGGRGSLEIQPFHGGSPGTASLRSRRYPDPDSMGTLDVELRLPSRVSILGADGRYHAPAESFRRMVAAASRRN